MSQPDSDGNDMALPVTEPGATPADERLQGLLSAVISISKALSLEEVLQCIVDSARRLMNAEYAALGVVGENQGLSHFVTAGIDKELAKLIGPLPTGHGVLGLLIREPHPIRLPNLHIHPASQGFPIHHPPMRTFLGVPIRIGGRVFGNLYLTEKAGGKLFTSEDEEMAIALAGAAGFAIVNARLYDEAQIRSRWIESGRMVAVRAMEDAGEASERILHFVAHTAAEVSDSVSVLIVGQPSASDQVEVLAGAGQVPPEMIGQVLDLTQDHRKVRSVLSSGKPAILEKSLNQLRTADGTRFASGLLARLGTGEAEQRLMLLMRTVERAEYSTMDGEMAAVFCAQSALALEIARAHQIREQLILYEDRERIARDLHDVVIQRVFAVGLHLQVLARFIVNPLGLEKIRTITGELDETIGELRETIYSLRASASRTNLLSSRIVDVVRKFSKPLSFTPRIVLSGPLDEQLPPGLDKQLLAVVSEGLSNAVRHAQAGKIDIAVTVRVGRVSVSVIDDGCGFLGTECSSGLMNMEARASLLNGFFRLKSVEGHGTSFYWSVPFSL